MMVAGELRPSSRRMLMSGAVLGMGNTGAALAAPKVVLDDVTCTNPRPETIGEQAQCFKPQMSNLRKPSFEVHFLESSPVSLGKG
eukprot:214627-Amphidinium_carterae.1